MGFVEVNGVPVLPLLSQRRSRRAHLARSDATSDGGDTPVRVAGAVPRTLRDASLHPLAILEMQGVCAHT